MNPEVAFGSLVGMLVALDWIAFLTLPDSWRLAFLTSYCAVLETTFSQQSRAEVFDFTIVISSLYHPSINCDAKVTAR